MKFVFLCFLSILCFIFYFDALYALNNKPRYDEQRTEELRQYLINYFSPVRNPQKIAKITLLKIIPQLIELGADPDTSTKKGDGFRAIDFAARNNYIDLIHFLFKHGADINANSTDSMRALYQAARRGHEETSAFLITISAKTKTEALKQNLCRFSYLNFYNKKPIKFPDIKNLLKEGADPNIKEDVHHCTALNFAAQIGDVDLINCLVFFGADVETSTKWGLTPLDHAACKGHVEATIRLIALGAKPCKNYFEKSKKTQEIISSYVSTDPTLPEEPALHRALRLELKNEEFDHILADARNLSIINKFDIQGQTALSIALIKRNEHAILALIAFGADPLLGIYNGVLLARQIKWQESSLYERILSLHLQRCLAILQALESELPREVVSLIIGRTLSCET